MVESTTAMETFGVVGFMYDKAESWSDHKNGSTMPNVFFDLDSEGHYTTVNTEEVDAANGTYTPLQSWSNNKRYTFFAYYPISGVELVSQTGSDYEGGTPTIKYTMNTTSAESFKASMVDLMTSPHQTDLFWFGSGEDQNNIDDGEIPFEFQHRLSAIGVNIKYSTSGSIILNDITLRLSTIKYNSIKIPLDGAKVTKEGSSFNMDLPFTLAEGGENLQGSGAKQLTDKLILIPQSELSVQVLISYKREVPGYSDTVVEDLRILSQQLELKEGYKHMINLNFTETNVTATASCANWVTIPSVNDTFN